MSNKQDQYKNDIRNRLLYIVETCANGNKNRFANRIGHSSGNVEAWFKKEKFALPSTKALYAISKEYSISLNWLVLGEGPMYLHDTNIIDKQTELEITTLKAQISVYEKILGKLKLQK